MATVDTSSSDERVGPGLSLQLVGAAVAVFASFLGVINIASVASHSGFEWHHVIQGAVEAYRAKFYPIYEEYLRPLFSWFHLDLSQPVQDLLTLVGAAFAAANAESFIRDGRALLFNSVVSFFRPNRFFGNRWTIVALVVGLFASQIIWFGSFELDPLSSPQFWSAPQSDWTLWVALLLAGLGVWIIVAVVWLGFRLGSVLLSADEKTPRQLRPWRVALIGLPVWVCLGVLALLIFAVAVVVLIVIAPFIAWRTVSMTVMLFVALLGLNAALVSGWL